MFLIRLLRWLFGFVRWEAEGGFPERLLNLAARQELPLWGVSRQGETLSACCFARDYRRMRPLARRTGMRMHLKKKRGVPFFLRRYRGRAGLAAGIAVFVLLLQLLSQRIWVVQVEGNERVSSDEILSVVSKMGVREGADGDSLDIPTLQLAALQQLPDLSWITVNLSCSIARVEVSERIPTPELSDPNRPSNLKAARDGVIVKLEVTGGQAMVQVGDAVVKDMLLVSGVVENTAGAVFKRSQGRVLARTERELEVRVPLQETRLLPTGRSVYRPTLQLFGLHIPLYTDGEVEGDYSLTTRRHPVVANGVNLPLGYTEEIYTMLSPQEVRYSETEAAALAAAKLDAREAGELAGTDIQSTSRNGRVENGYYILTGTYVCIEDIGVEEQILIADS